MLTELEVAARRAEIELADAEALLKICDGLQEELAKQWRPRKKKRNGEFRRTRRQLFELWDYGCKRMRFNPRISITRRDLRLQSRKLDMRWDTDDQIRFYGKNPWGVTDTKITMARLRGE